MTPAARLGDVRQMRKPVFPLALILCAAAACSPMRETRGYVPDDVLLGELKPGVHDKNSVASLLGSPSSVATFDGATWYYITRKTEQLAFFAEKVTDQQVVAIDFDDQGVMTGVRRFTLADANDVQFVERSTPSLGKELTVLQQFFGNIGRFTSEKNR
jgi:outer membrane protein assembly factor BamE (lipoprotein component of BamABCDE complex)